MEELSLAGERAGLSACDISILREKGWSVMKLATLQGCHDDVIAKVVEQCREQNENFMADELMMHDMVGFADLIARGIRCHEAKRGASDWMVEHILHGERERKKLLKRHEEEDVAKRVPHRGTAKRARWPTRLGKMLAGAGDDLALREQIEKKERDRWLGELRQIMSEARLPAVAWLIVKSLSTESERAGGPTPSGST